MAKKFFKDERKCDGRNSKKFRSFNNENYAKHMALRLNKFIVSNFLQIYCESHHYCCHRWKIYLFIFFKIRNYYLALANKNGTDTLIGINFSLRMDLESTKGLHFQSRFAEERLTGV